MLDLWRRHEDAIAQYQKTLERIPQFPWPYHLMADVYARQKRFDDALAAERKYVALSVDDPDVLQAFEQAYATSGDEGYWTWRLERLGDQARRTGKTPSAQLAIAHAQLGDRDAAFECLEKAYLDRASPLILLNANPVWDPVRDDPRFKDLLRRLNFP